jgi:hypothetical protein
MRLPVPILVVLSCLLARAPGLAHAQSLLTPERVQEALERTDQRIETAAAVVTGDDHPQAGTELEAARGLQAQARTEFSATHLQVAMDLTLRARARADRAVALVKGLPDPDRVLNQLERTRDVLDRVRGHIQDCNQDSARSLLSVADEMQLRAEAAARESRFLAALQLTLGARDRVMLVRRMCRMEEDVESVATHALQRTDEWIRRARAASQGGAPRAAELLTRAEGLQTQAQAQFLNRNFEAALRLTTNAGALARRAARLAERR